MKLNFKHYLSTQEGLYLNFSFILKVGCIYIYILKYIYPNSVYWRDLEIIYDIYDLEN